MPMCNENAQSLFIKFLEQYTDVSKVYWYYWYPLCILKKEVPVVAYNIRKIYCDNGIHHLEAVLKCHNIRKVKAFQMLNDNTEAQTEDLVELLYRKEDDVYTFPWKVETYYYDDSKKWMIYVSHEWSITFTGELLVNTAKEVIPTQFLYA